eukprot:gnl/TRDRNA2_/TRDRNA2_159853_c1_seq1.p1 gnl/TRDRNA2_/TRDRNA2_159853_c1~~gnl/TRDRNA2_/TRDRNA2_159853_c1_seq1.p1  ORF type:complete len:398 (-),score=68.32 gnl/TRDRNA2_/TRDRNA2_159853_c1_seq1:40-1158(-)
MRPPTGDEVFGEPVSVPASWVMKKLVHIHGCWSENVYETFSGGTERELLYELNRDSQEDKLRMVRFQEFAIGSRHMGNLVVDISTALPYSLAPWNGTRFYRDRMLSSYLGPGAARAASVPRRALLSSNPQPLKAIIIHNRRFTKDEIAMLQDLAAQLTKDGVAETEYLDWMRVGDNRADFGAHLRKVQETDIMISSVGTALMYLPFLRDGSAFVALGQVLVERDMGPRREVPSFMEQHMSAGTPYVKSFYYDSTERMSGLHAEPLMALAKQAAEAVRNGFAIPVPPEQNLSPEGQVLHELFTKHPEAGEIIVRLRNTEWECVRAIWNEYVVYEIGPWAHGGKCDGWHSAGAEKNTLRELRTKYGLQGWGAEE